MSNRKFPLTRFYILDCLLFRCDPSKLERNDMSPVIVAKQIRLEICPVDGVSHDRGIISSNFVGSIYNCLEISFKWMKEPGDDSHSGSCQGFIYPQINLTGNNLAAVRVFEVSFPETDENNFPRIRVARLTSIHKSDNLEIRSADPQLHRCLIGCFPICCFHQLESLVWVLHITSILMKLLLQPSRFQQRL